MPPATPLDEDEVTLTPEMAFQQATERFSAKVDARLEEIIGREEPVENLHDGLTYALGLDLADARARGKRIRPVLCLMTAEALGGDLQQATNFACAIELMHNFALVHDDIEDGDEVRRNRPTVWRHYGLAHGINIGDYLFCKVWSTLLEDDGLGAETRLALLRLMSETLDHTHIGQSLEITQRANRRFTLEEYFRLVREKTGFYLAAPMLGGAIVANAPTPVRTTLAKFGEVVGPLFQITDDLLDLTAGKGRGGKIGSDLREGKRSYLVAHVTATAPDAEIEHLYDILDKPREQTTDADVAAALALFEKHGALEAARAQCDALLEQALGILRRLPAPLEGVLSVFARQVASRER
ncbi:MAG: geranylgeranyl diphosphate synthase, type [Candidatus Sumerlaeota bacterium]|nr:geranylgeranyl diphosphate synthase, type [Candidatus Sumerlaeota bacterium]